MGNTGTRLPKPKFKWRPWILSYLLILELGVFPYTQNASTAYKSSQISTQKVETIASIVYFPAHTPTVNISVFPTQISKPTPLPTKQPQKPVARVKVIKAAVRIKPIEQPALPISELIDRYGGQYGVDPNLLHKIAACESGHNPNAVNGPYAGMYQYLASTWSSNRRAMGEDPDPNLRFNAEEAIKTTAFKISRDGTGAWPVCGRS